MTASKAPNQRAPHRRLPLSEKRRIVELTLREGASIREIAREQGINRNSLYQWQALYRTGKLGAKPTPHAHASASSATFVPVSVVSDVRMRRCRPDWNAHGCIVVQLTLASGATLRIETAELNTALICALVAEARR
jgi:transposase-like protein